MRTVLPCPRDRAFDLARDLELHPKTTGRSRERVVSAPHRLAEMGDEITFEARHFGLVRRLTAKVVELNPPHSFTDEMLTGPFRRMRHEHRFEATESGTCMTDMLEFAFLPVIDQLVLGPYMKRFLVLRGLELARLASEM